MRLYVGQRWPTYSVERISVRKEVWASDLGGMMLSIFDVYLISAIGPLSDAQVWI